MTKSTSSAAATGLPEAREFPARLRSVADLDADISRLHELLMATADVVIDMPFERDGVRDTHLDRACALLMIAVGLAGQASADIEANFSSLAVRS